MNRSNANNLAFIGAPYLLAASALDEKQIVADALSQLGLLPVETGLVPQSAHYFSTVGKLLDRSACYILLLTDHHVQLPDTTKNLLERELELTKSSDIPVIALIHESAGDLLFVRRQLEDCNLMDEVYWNDLDQLREGAEVALREYLSQRTELPHHLPVVETMNLADSALYKKSIKLQGFYYSAIYMTVKEYSVEIGLEEVEINGAWVYPAREWGFHDSLRKKRFSENEVYVGTAMSKAGFLHIKLERNMAPPDSLELRLYLGAMTDVRALAEENSDILFGSVHGLTSRVPNQNFAYKTIVARCGSDGKSIGRRYKNQIARHLNISRKSFVTKLEKYRFHEMPEMQLDRIKISTPEHIEGTYRIWTEGRKGRNEIAQSRMIVRSNYSATICNPVFEKGKEQLCEIFFSSWLDEIRLIFVMRRQHDGHGPSDIASMAIMELPSKDHIGAILIGSFCSAGQKKDDRSVYLKTGNRERTSDLLPHEAHEAVQAGLHKTGVRGGYFVAKREELGREVVADFVQENDIDRNDIDMLHLLRAANGRRNKKPKNKK